MNTREFEFRRWGNWLEERAQTLRQAEQVAELRRGGSPTPKPGCSFRVEADRAFGQFDVWVTGEADFDVMDAQTKGFAHNVWGMILSDVSFEAAFDDFLNRVTQHPIPGRDTPASLRSAWFSCEKRPVATQGLRFTMNVPGSSRLPCYLTRSMA